jgi:hypothetical protein
MPYGTRQFTTSDPEPLLFAAGLDAIKSAVVRSSSVTADATGKRRLIAGTLLRAVVVDGKKKYEEYKGSGTVEGVLEQSVDFLGSGANYDKEVAVLYHGCVFRTSAIVNYSTYGAAAKTALNTCKFEDA